MRGDVLGGTADMARDGTGVGRRRHGLRLGYGAQKMTPNRRTSAVRRMEQGREATVGRLPERRESAQVVYGLQLGPSARVRGSEGKLCRSRKWAVRSGRGGWADTRWAKGRETAELGWCWASRPKGKRERGRNRFPFSKSFPFCFQIQIQMQTKSTSNMI